MQLTKKTSLQKVESDVKETLDWKLTQLQEKNLPVEQGLADYIYLGMQGIDTDIEQLNNYITTIKDKVNELKANKEDTSHKIAVWLQDTGLDKINGISVSSITINKGKDSVTTTTTVKEFKTDLPQEQINDLISENNLGDWVDVEKETKSKPTIDKIKVNKLRKVK